MSGSPNVSDIEFRPLSRSFADDPYSVYACLRSCDSPYHYEDMDMVMLSRYDDIDLVAGDSFMVRSLVGYASDSELLSRQRRLNWDGMPYHERVVQFSLLDSDGDIHRRLRSLVFGHLTRDRVNFLGSYIASHVSFLLDSFGSREIDFTNDFAVHIPGCVICELLGVPSSDAPMLREWTERIVNFFDVDRSDSKKLLAEDSSRLFYDYLIDLKRLRERSPCDDLISRLLSGGGFLDDDEFVSTSMLLLMAGHGSTIDILGSSLDVLLRHPDSLSILKTDAPVPSLLLEELFRFEPPLPFFHRHATRDVTIRDYTYPSGTTFGLLYGSGNRDSSIFPLADSFIPDRTPNRHLSFGRGAHLCLGNHLARLTLSTTLRLFFERFPSPELVESATYKRGLSVRGPESLIIDLGVSP